MPAQLKIINFKNDFYVQYNINYLEACANKRKLYDTFMKNMIVILINLFDTCKEALLCLHVLFYFMEVY